MLEPVPSSSLHLPRSQTSKAMTWDLHTDHDRSCPPWTADFRCRADPARTEVLPQLRRNSDNCVTTSTFASFSTARQGVAFHARIADRDAREPPPTQPGGVRRQGGCCSCGPLPGWLHASPLSTHQVAWHATLAALQRWRGASPCQPTPVAPLPAWPSQSCSSCLQVGAEARKPRPRLPPHRARPPSGRPRRRCRP